MKLELELLREIWCGEGSEVLGGLNGFLKVLRAAEQVDASQGLTDAVHLQSMSSATASTI